MGSSGSKSRSNGGASSSKGRNKGSRVFQSSCLGTTSDDSNHVGDHDIKESGGNNSSIVSDHTESFKVQVNCRKQCNESLSSNSELDEYNQASIRNTTSRMGSNSARATSTPSFTSQSSVVSRFSFTPGNASFRLSRATSLGSSRAYHMPSTTLQMLNDEEAQLQSRSADSAPDDNETRQSSDYLRSSHSQHYEDTSDHLHHHNHATNFSDNNGENKVTSSINGEHRDRDNTKVGNGGTSQSPRIFNGSDSYGARISERRTGAQEHVEPNVCFSRSLSVGRLRGRVLRRSPPSDISLCPSQLEQISRDASQVSGRQALGSERRISESEADSSNPPITSTYPLSGSSSSLFGSHYHEPEHARSRDTRYHDLLEHRSNFLERRRRIRSQVRALQRLGSRFENLSGHDRACILSGHHRMGRCTCRTTSRDSNLNDDTSARASISRIIMLAEALFEVLDEIHQQSVVLSSQPLLSSLGSMPAPNEVVECLPVKLYTKMQKQQNEEAAQCYICLVEYEEGDSMRMLPCHHEFHSTCIDKWLKEIHRVCPLCRGDVCRSDSLTPEG